ncbi:MAG TPA: hypothetical protein RMF84_21215 [Polyangiaceae bacterium LLY-WYZ-14_1]|nr:hypothetical protein [Polyangiaceae bacterium LLY-WYZ-14_1]
METARMVIDVGRVWVAVGLAVALPFVTIGIGRVAEGAQGASIPFRLLMIPGSVVLWPVVLWRWIVAWRESAPERSATGPEAK